MLLPFRWMIFVNFFHAVNIAIKQQQYCNTVRPQLNCDRFTKHMTSQTWRLKRLFLKYSFAFNTRYEHLYNLKRLYFGYLSEILWYKTKLFCCHCPLIEYVGKRENVSRGCLSDVQNGPYISASNIYCITSISVETLFREYELRYG